MPLCTDKISFRLLQEKKESNIFIELINKWQPCLRIVIVWAYLY